jgi:hypothetical protein
MTTYRDLVFDEAQKLGIVGLNDESADFILWERTAFPFLDEAELRHEIALELAHGGWTMKGRVKTEGPTAWDMLSAEEPEDP